MLYLLAGVAAALTCFLFLTKEMMLGYAAMVFWLLFGGYCISVAPAIGFGDMYFLTGFASILGMGFLTGFGMYGMRKIKAPDADEGAYLDEPEGDVKDAIRQPDSAPQRQTKARVGVRERVAKRREELGG